MMLSERKAPEKGSKSPFGPTTQKDQLENKKPTDSQRTLQGLIAISVVLAIGLIVGKGVWLHFDKAERTKQREGTPKALAIAPSPSPSASPKRVTVVTPKGSPVKPYVPRKNNVRSPSSKRSKPVRIARAKKSNGPLERDKEFIRQSVKAGREERKRGDMSKPNPMATPSFLASQATPPPEKKPATPAPTPPPVTTSGRTVTGGSEN